MLEKLLPLLAVFLLFGAVMAFDAAAPGHEKSRVSAAGFVLDSNSNGNPDCGDHLVREIPAEPISRIYASEIKVFHPARQIGGITDSDGNGWPDYCDSRSVPPSETFADTDTYHQLYQFTSGPWLTSFSVDSDQNGCFDYCDCLPGEFTGDACYDGDVYHFECGAPVSKVQECNINECGDPLISECSGNDVIVYQTCYTGSCADGACTVSSEKSAVAVDTADCGESSCGDTSSWTGCFSSGGITFLAKTRLCTDRGCSGGECTETQRTEYVDRSDCGNSCLYICVTPRCPFCDSSCVVYRGLAPLPGC